MPRYRIYAVFSINLNDEVEASSPREAALAFDGIPSIPYGVDFELEDTAPRMILVLDPETGETLHEEHY